MKMAICFAPQVVLIAHLFVPVACAGVEPGIRSSDTAMPAHDAVPTTGSRPLATAPQTAPVCEYVVVDNRPGIRLADFQATDSDYSASDDHYDTPWDATGSQDRCCVIVVEGRLAAGCVGSKSYGEGCCCRVTRAEPLVATVIDLFDARGEPESTSARSAGPWIARGRCDSRAE